MFGDDIVKALTLQIDVTGNHATAFTSLQKTVQNVAEQWSSLGNISANVEAGIATDLQNTIKEWTPYNAALGAAGLAWGALKSAATGTLDILKAGGGLNEATSRLESLAASSSKTAGAWVAMLDDIGGGMESIERTTQAAAQSIQRGFSAEQSQTIYAFAKAYTEAVGGSFLDVANTIERAMLTGQSETLRGMGIMVEKGMTTADAMKLLKTSMDKLGDGAFNMNDSLQAVAQSMGNAFARIGMEGNRVLGIDGLGGAVEMFRDTMWEIGNQGDVIAPVLLAPWLELKNVVRDAVDLVGLGTGSMRTSISSLALFTADVMYAIPVTVENIYNEMRRQARDSVAWFLELAATANSFLPQAVQFNQTGLLETLAKFETETATGMASYWNERRDALKDQIGLAIATPDASDFGKMADNADYRKTTGADGIDVYTGKKTSGVDVTFGGGLSGSNTKTTKATQPTKATTSSAAPSSGYFEQIANGIDAYAKSIASLGEVVNQTQAGINNIYEQAAGFTTGAYDPFSFSSQRKLEETKKLAGDLASQKNRELDLVERQVSAQEKLADSMTKPREIVFNIPNDANTTERFIREVVSFLVKLAEAEGVQVIGS